MHTLINNKKANQLKTIVQDKPLGAINQALSSDKNVLERKDTRELDGNTLANKKTNSLIMQFYTYNKIDQA